MADVPWDRDWSHQTAFSFPGVLKRGVSSSTVFPEVEEAGGGPGVPRTHT